MARTGSGSAFHRAAGGAVMAVTLLGGICAQTVVRTTLLSRPPAGGDPVGVWSGNAYLSIEAYESGAPILHVQDESGAEIERVVVQALGARHLQVISDDFARGPDGSLAVTGLAWDGGDHVGRFLNIISPDGATQTVVRTNPYAPHALTFAADGTVWTVGMEVRPEGGYKGDEDGYLIVRRFDKTGRLLGGAVPRTLFPGRQGPVGGSILVASKDRVGWFSPLSHHYTEFSLDGKRLATYPFPVALNDTQGMALCDDNSVWVSFQSGPRSSVVSTLDRTQGTWSNGAPQPYVALMGCSGTTLVTSSNSRQLEWRTPK